MALGDGYQVEVEGDRVTSWGQLRKDDGRSAEQSRGLSFRVSARLQTLVLLEFGRVLQLFVAATPIDETRTWLLGRYYYSGPMRWLDIAAYFTLVDHALADARESGEPEDGHATASLRVHA